MNKMRLSAIVAACGLATTALAWTTPASAQATEVKEKPPLYTYQSSWTYPRARWGEVDKDNAATNKTLDKAMASGVLVGYGDDSSLIHEDGGYTHDGWFQSMSIAGLLNTLDEIYKAGGAASPLLGSATKHSDSLWVSRYYNWHAGSWKGAYTRVAVYKLKAGAAPDSIDLLAKSFLVPLLEKLLADGAILEYEIDVESIHTESPEIFAIDILMPNPTGFDKLDAALHEAAHKNPSAGALFGSMTDSSGHHDYLMRTNVTYK